MRGPIRVLVADDSAAMRSALRALLESDGITVVAEAKDGAEAVEKAESLSPDVITMDVLMPRLNGLQATRRIMQRSPSRILLVCAVGDEGGVDLSFRAMDIGALELVAKPTATQDLRAWGAELRESVKLMAEVPVVRRWRASPSVAPASMGAPTQRASVIGIAASTGGPPALAQLLSRLPRDLPVSILVAQHMANGFVAGLHRWLLEVSGLPVRVATEGALLERGLVYLAPDGCDLEVTPELKLKVESSTSHHTPSGDRLLKSLARTMRSRAVGIVLTGMGDDGARGLAAIRAAGGRTLAQDQATSVVYGMPKAAVEAGVVDQIVALDAIPALILDLVGKESS
jgi:two-component system chemotaxis response regulator CheB